MKWQTDRDLLASTSPFSVLDAAALDALLPHFQAVELAPGQTLFRQGDTADALFVLAEGGLEVLVGRDQRISTVTPGSCVGEIAFFDSFRRGGEEPAGARTATVRAQGPARLLQLPEALARQLYREEPGFRAALAALMERRATELRDLLTPLFGELSEELQRDLHGCLERVAVPAGEILFRAGDAGDAVYLLLAGRMQVFRETEGELSVLADLGQGELIGELALLTGEPRMASVRATRDSVVARLSEQGLLKVLRRHPDALFALTRRLARRIGKPSAPPPPPKTFVLLPAHPEVPAGAFAEELARYLPGSTFVLDAPRFDAANGAGASAAEASDPRNRTLAAWLSRLEQGHDFILLLADHSPGPWTFRCLRQADRIVLLGRTADDPAPGPVERMVQDGFLPARRRADRLVLLHPAGTVRPERTARWLDSRPGVPHHHVRLGDREHLARLARHLTGRAVGLVLGGGGARGFAHAGVLRALAELSVPVDCFGGTSMGAGLAAAGAMQAQPPEVLASLRKAFIESGVTRAWTLPFVSILNTRALDKALVELGQGRNIEDLWVPFFCVSTNLTAMAVEIHERGPLWKATRASSSMPMVFPPVFRDGEVLVDGGLLDNLPVAAMRQRCPRVVLACDVVKPPQARVSRDLLEVPSGWSLLWQRLFRRRAKRVRVPRLLDLATYSLICASVIAARRAGESADLVLRPDVARFGTLEFAAIDELVQRGYDHTMEHRERLLALTAFARPQPEAAERAVLAAPA
jgi:predicted acylesterase/phospholipase RssA/CRP-like cAMP-binding protein